MAMSKAENLPEEIIIEILTRLPAKFIGQYRCVSMKWLNFLSDPQLIKAHLNIHAHKEEEEKRIWVCDNSLHIITFDQPNETKPILRKLNFQHLSDNWARVVGSCNGLVLVENEEMIQFLINPTTLKYHTISNFHLALPMDHSFSMSGLGYDFTTDDYKVVKLSQYDYAYDDYSIFVDVYSVRKGLWRRLECLPLGYEFKRFASGVLVHGALHWLATKISDCSLVIVAFDLSGEKFLEVPTPTTLDKDNMFFIKLVACSGCLCMSADTEEHLSVFWMLKEYGVEKSWIRYYIAWDIKSEDDEFIVHNMKEDQCDNMIVALSGGGVTFIESRYSYILAVELRSTALPDALFTGTNLLQWNRMLESCGQSHKHGSQYDLVATYQNSIIISRVLLLNYDVTKWIDDLIKAM